MKRQHPIRIGLVVSYLTTILFALVFKTIPMVIASRMSKTIGIPAL